MEIGFMKTLTTKTDLVLWFKRKIWSIEPKEEMPFGLLRAFNELFVSYEAFNEANRLCFDAETRSDFLGGMFEVLSDDPGRTVKASSLIPGFIGLVLSEELGGDYHVSFARLLEMCSELLRVEQGEL